MRRNILNKVNDIVSVIPNLFSIISPTMMRDVTMLSFIWEEMRVPSFPMIKTTISRSDHASQIEKFDDRSN